MDGWKGDKGKEEDRQWWGSTVVRKAVRMMEYTVNVKRYGASLGRDYIITCICFFTTSIALKTLCISYMHS